MAVLGAGGEGSGMELSYTQVCAAVTQAAENLQATLAEDGYYLQRGGRQIDVAMNHCAPPAVGLGGQILV